MAQATSTLWQEILQQVRAHAPQIFRAWFYELDVASLDRGTLVIEVGNEHQRSFLEGAGRSAMTQAAQAATGRLVHLQYRVRAEAAPCERPPAFDTGCTFDSFVVGPESNLAYNAAMAVAHDPGGAYNPLLIIAQRGTGKTHLLQAIANAAAQAGGRGANYFTALEFTARFVKSLECGMPGAFRAEACETDILLIDDVDALKWKERTLEELFHIYQAMACAGRQLVFSASVPIEKAEGLGERLTSRLASGLCATLEPPSFETRCLILSARAQRQGIDLPEEVTHHLARRFEHNVAELLDALRRVVAASQAKGEAIHLPLARHALDEDEAAIPVNTILMAVSARFEVPQERLASGKPGRKLGVARDAAVYLSRRLTSLGVDEIGSFFGGLSPVQVVEIGRRVERERSSDESFAALLDEIAKEAKNAS